MAAIHKAGSVACFIIGGLLVLMSISNVLAAGTFLNPVPGLVQYHHYLLGGGFGAGLIALGWYIRVMSKN